jgi:hypothetical protein
MRSVSLVVAIVMMSNQVNAQPTTSTRQFDSNNREIGRTDCSGNRCQFYNSNNKNIGRSEQDSYGNTRFYNENNKLIGTDKAKR